MRQGIVYVTDELLKTIPFLLEPDHRIVAEKGHLGYVELLIEGPHMPEVLEDGIVVPVAIYIQKHMDTTATGRWSHIGGDGWTVDLNGVDLPF